MHSDPSFEKRLNETIGQLFAKVTIQDLEESIQMGWLGSNQFSASFNFDEVDFMEVLSAMSEPLGGWDVGNGLIGGSQSGDGLTVSPRFRIEAKATSEGEIIWRAVVV